MYKILVILSLICFLISCNQENIKDSNLIESGNENIYTNMDIVSIPLGTNLEKLKGINKFNGESLTIEVNIDDFGSELLNKLKGAKGKTLHIAVYSEKEDLLVINNNDYIEYQKLDFDDKEIILLIGKKIGRVQCGNKTDITCK